MNPRIITTLFESPIGLLMLGADSHGLVLCNMLDAHPTLRLLARLKDRGFEISSGSNKIIAMATTQLQEYFAGERREFDISLNRHLTTFQTLVSDAILAIPYGRTKTYAQIASEIGRPGAVRATGSACGANPLLIFVPCHRVVASTDLGGFALDIEIKKHLLHLEKS